MTRRVALGLAVFAGVIWAVVQLTYTSLAVSLSDRELVECGVDASRTDLLKLLSIGVAVAAALAFVLSFRRRFAPALAFLAVEAVLAIVWVSQGAWDAAGCAIE
jgi:hypothetical protein